MPNKKFFPAIGLVASKQPVKKIFYLSLLHCKSPLTHPQSPHNIAPLGQKSGAPLRTKKGLTAPLPPPIDSPGVVKARRRDGKGERRQMLTAIAANKSQKYFSYPIPHLLKTYAFSTRKTNHAANCAST